MLLYLDQYIIYIYSNCHFYPHFLGFATNNCRASKNAFTEWTVETLPWPSFWRMPGGAGAGRLVPNWLDSYEVGELHVSIYCKLLQPRSIIQLVMWFHDVSRVFLVLLYYVIFCSYFRWWLPHNSLQPGCRVARIDSKSHLEQSGQGGRWHAK